MSEHSHTHAPGEAHSHSHAPAPPPQVVPQPDPLVQAFIDQSFVPVPMDIQSEGTVATCSAHQLEKCDDCDVDFCIMNRLSRLLAANPNLRCPPPSNMVSQTLTQMVTAAKEEGNTFFKTGRLVPALQRYTAAASVAVQRPPWEANQFMREEVSTVISNRSAAFHDMNDYISALTDAEIVITTRRNWCKGHLRKAKALMGIHAYKDALDAANLGLSFEAENPELLAIMADIKRAQNKDDIPSQRSAVPTEVSA